MDTLIYVYVVLSITKVARSGIEQKTTFTRIAKQAEAEKYETTAALRRQAASPSTAQTAGSVRSAAAAACDYLAQCCLSGYNAGKLCGRTLYYSHHTFKNYCVMDYVNCVERYQVWQTVHMGPCFNVTELDEHLKYPYDDDYCLDQYYILEDH